MTAHDFYELLHVDATILVMINITDELFPDHVGHNVPAGSLIAECGLQLFFVNVVVFARVKSLESFFQVFIIDLTA